MNGPLGHLHPHLQQQQDQLLSPRVQQLPHAQQQPREKRQQSKEPHQVWILCFKFSLNPHC